MFENVSLSNLYNLPYAKEIVVWTVACTKRYEDFSYSGRNFACQKEALKTTTSYICRNLFAVVMGRLLAFAFLFYLNGIGHQFVSGDRPICDPNLPEDASTAEIEGSVKYNLIETDVSCFYNRVCPMFPPGLCLVI